MSFSIPNGAQLYMGLTYSSDKVITAITNANPPVASSTAHGLSANDVVVLNTGWSDFQDRTVKVTAPDANTFGILLDDDDTTDVNRFPSGGGAGKAKKVETWVEITQILNSATEGGDPTYVTGKPLNPPIEFRIPTGNSASGWNLDLGYDRSLPWYPALQNVSRSRTSQAFKLRLVSGDEIYYNCVVFFNGQPSLNVDQVMIVKASLSFQGLYTSYEAV